MGFNTYCINSLNEVIEKIIFKPKSPFELNTIIYQNSGVKELLTFGLSDKHGITANLEYITLQQLIRKLSEKTGGEIEEKPLVWKVYGILKKMNTDKYPELKSYLKDEIRAIQLAEKLTDIFDDYYSYEITELSGWQKEIWEKLPTNYFQGFHVNNIIDNLTKLNNIEEITLIGLDYITPLQYKLLNALKNLTTINFYFVYPFAIKAAENTEYWTFKNKTLEKLEILGAVQYAPTKKEENTLLYSLQTNSNQPILIDGTVKILNAYSTKREVEDLYNNILYLCQNDGIKPNDILILCPNIADYQPYIDAVFQSDDFPVKLPYHISDLPKGGFKNKVDLVLNTFSLSNKLSLKDVSTYLENPFIQKRYGIKDYATAIEYLKRTAFVLGNAEDRSSDLSLIGWPQSKKRLIYGLTMLTNEKYDDVTPFDEAEGQNAFQILGVVSLVDDLFSWAENNEEKTFNSWFEDFAQRYNDLFGNENEDISPEDLKIWSLFEGLYDSSNSISSQVFKYIMGNQLEQFAKDRKKITNGIVISDISSNKAISSPVVCVIGLNDLSFPRKNIEYEFDYLKNKGVRLSKKEIDKLDYQSAILSAERYLFLSYVGTNTKNNTTLLPSIFLNNTIDTLTELTGTTNVSEKYPAKSSAAFYTNLKDEPFSFSQSNSERKLKDITEDIVKEERKTSNITLEELIKYFQNPSKWFFNNILQVSLFEKDEEVQENELFSQGNLEAWAVRNNYLQSAFNPNTEIEIENKQNLQLPLGGLGTTISDGVIDKFKPLFNQLSKEATTDQVEFLQDEIQLDEEIKLNSSKTLFYKDKSNSLYRVFWESKEIDNNQLDSKIGKKVIEIAITGAFYAAQGHINKTKYYYQDENDDVDYKEFSFDTPDAAKDWLTEITQLYINKPDHRPVHFYPKVSFQHKSSNIGVNDYEQEFNNDDAYAHKYPDTYEQKAYNQLRKDTLEHEVQVTRDWDKYNEKFWEIIKEA